MRVDDKMPAMFLHNPMFYYSQLIDLVYQTHRQRKEDYQTKLKVRKKFYEILKDNLDVPFDLYIVGSSQTQFALKSSDIDLCFLAYDSHGKIDQRFVKDRKIAISLLQSIKNIIETKFQMKKIQLMNARVPILKIETAQSFCRFAIDLNINGDVSIRNTFLLTYYQELDVRVAPLVVAVKSWARKNRIDSPFHGTLSSYSLSLMVIHFLQNIDPPLLPLLRSEVSDKLIIDRIVQTGFLQEHLSLFILETRRKFITYNNWLLGELFYYFIEYYYHRLIFRFQVSIKESFSHRSKAADSLIWIEDPFHYHNTANSVSSSSFSSIIDAFSNAYASLKGFTLTPQFFDL